jgi:hypothetical protein
VLSEQMVKLLAYLEKSQASGLASDERGRRAGVDTINLDFVASPTGGSTRAMVRKCILLAFALKSYLNRCPGTAG